LLLRRVSILDYSHPGVGSSWLVCLKFPR